MKRILLVLLVLGAGIGGLTLLNANVFALAAADEADLATYVVVRKDLEITLTETGSLMAKKSETLQPKFRGSAKINFLIPEGEEVKKGTPVCKFDSKDAEKALDDLELQLLSAQTALKTAQTNLEIQHSDNITNISKADIAYEKAVKDLERYRDGDAPQENRKLEIALKDAKTTFAKAKKKYEDSVKLIDLKYINQAELDDHQIAFEKAEIQRDEADLAIKLHKKYAYPMMMTEKENAVAEARRARDTAKKRAESEVGQKAVLVTQAEKRVKKYADSIEKAKEDLENMVLKAPSDGIIVYGDPRQPWYREQIKIGGQVGRGHTLMTIPVLSVMQVKLSVHEADISKVHAGLKTRVTMDSYPGLMLQGVVHKVASIAGGSEPWQPSSNVKKFDVEITIDNDQKLKPGVSAKVEILIDTRKDALFVPLQCAFLEGGKHWVNLEEGVEIKRREIVPGLANDSYLEVLEGLKEGDRVLLYNPNLPPPSGDESEEQSDETETTVEAATTAGS